jgi:16S rRNA C1402 N4-methylase RsmH
VLNDQNPITDAKRNNTNADGNLGQKWGSTKLSKSRSPMKRKFTATRIAMNQEKKNCQDRGEGGGQKRKPDSLIVRINNRP